MLEKVTTGLATDLRAYYEVLYALAMVPDETQEERIQYIFEVGLVLSLQPHLSHPCAGQELWSHALPGLSTEELPQARIHRTQVHGSPFPRSVCADGASKAYL